MGNDSSGTILTTVRAAVVVLSAALLSACGVSDEPVQPIVPAVHQPLVSDLSYSPRSAMQATGGTATVRGSINFSDAGADVISLHMITSAGEDMDIPLPQMKGVLGGTVLGELVVSLDVAGTHTFELWVTDSTGMASNLLYGTFEVLPQAPPPIAVDHTPSIANLRLSPGFAYTAAGGTVAISASIDFSDAGGDIVAIRATSAAGLDVTFSTPELQGTTSGSSAARLLFPVDKVGLHTIRFWAVDSKGATSNLLSGTFEVRAVPVSNHPPSISSLRYAPRSAYQIPNGAVAMLDTVDFADAGGDVVQLRLSISGGAALSADTTDLAGTQSGTASGAFALPIDQVGKYAFQIWAVDSKGNESNRLDGTFEVLPPDTWTKLAVVPPAALNAIAFNSARYVAVGVAGTVMTSVDSSNWTAQSAGADLSLQSVTASPSRFVAVGESAGGQAVIVASDGGAWSQSYGASLPSTLSKVIWMGSQFMAVGHERYGVDARLYALILTSPDGLTWSQRAVRAIEVGDFGLHPRGMKSVAWSGGVFVATGIDPDWEPAVWRSTDTELWTKSLLPPDAVWTGLYDIAWGMGRFVAVGPQGWPTDHAPVFTSSDGLVWQTGPVTDKLPAMNSVSSSATAYVAVGESDRESSADGTTWTVFPMSGCGSGVIWDGARFIAVGQRICRSE